MHTFNRGDPALELRLYITMNFRYPEVAANKKKIRTALVQFEVSPNGKVRNSEIAKSTRYEDLDNEAVRFILENPPWSPGYQRGRPVRVLFNYPITFLPQ